MMTVLHDDDSNTTTELDQAHELANLKQFMDGHMRSLAQIYDVHHICGTYSHIITVITMDPDVS